MIVNSLYAKLSHGYNISHGFIYPELEKSSASFVTTLTVDYLYIISFVLKQFECFEPFFLLLAVRLS